MLVKTFGSAVYGVDAITITIEVNVSGGERETRTLDPTIMSRVL